MLQNTKRYELGRSSSGNSVRDSVLLGLALMLLATTPAHSQTTAMIVGSNSSGVSSNVTTTTNFYYTIVGYTNTDSNNTLTISGSGVTVGNLGGSGSPYDASISVGNAGNGNQMIISNGASVTATAGLAIGSISPSSSNTVTVTGTSSSLNISGGIFLGFDSNTSGNQLIINNHGTVTDTNTGDTIALELGYGTNANSNSVTVSNSGVLNVNGILVGASNNSGNQLVVSGSGTVTSTASTLGSSGSSNNSALISGAGSLWSINSGSSSNTGLTIGDSSSGNILTISNGGTLNVTGGTVIGTDLSLPGTPGSNNSVLVTGTGSTFSNSAAITVGASGGGTLTVAAGGAVTAPAIYLAVSNNSVGTLNIGAFGANGAAGTLTTTNIYFGSGTATLNFNQSNTTTIGANISGNGSVSQYGSGTTILTGNNTYSGVTTITNGTLQLGDGSTNASGFLSSMGTGAISNNGTLAFDQYNTFTVSNTISGSGTLVQGAGGTSILIANNSYSGGTVITNGFLQVGTNGSTGSLGSGGVSLSNSATFTYDRGDASTLSNAITGVGNVAFSGSGTTTLSGNSTYNGFTYVTAGTVDVTGSISNSTNRLNVGVSNGVGYNNATLIFTNGGINAANALNIGSYSGGNSNTVIVTGATLNLQTNTAGSIGVGGNGASYNSLQITNGGHVLGGNVFVGFSGGSNNSLSIGGTGSSLTAQGTAVGYFVGSNSSYNSLLVSTGGTLTTFGNTYLSENGASNNTVLVTGAGALWSNSAVISVGDNGSATLTLANGGTVDATTIGLASSNGSAGTLNIGTYGSDGAGGTLNATNITFGSGSGVLNFNQSNAVSLGSVISGNGSVNQLGTGTTTLTGNNTYSGLTTISNGVFQLGDGSSSVGFGSSAISNNASLVLDSSAGLTLSGAISGSGSLSQIGSGTSILSGNNTYSGLTTISSGVLQLGNGSSSVGFGSSAISNNASLVLNSSGTLSLGGVISGSGSLKQIGSGVSILSGNNTYSGPTLVSAGTLQANSVNALGTGAVTLTNSATLSVNSLLTITSFNWTTTSSYVAIAGLGTNYLNVTGAVTLGGPTNTFNLTGDSFSSTNPIELMAWGTPNAYTTNNFSALGVTGYSLSISNNALWITGSSGLIASNTVTTVSGTSTYPNVIFLPSGVLNITPSGNLTITGGVTATNNGTVILNGTLTTPSLTIPNGGTLTGTGGTLNGSLTITPGGSFILMVSSDSQYSNLVINGTITLGGTLIVEGINGYPLHFGDKYTFLSTSNSITGSFSSIETPVGFRARVVLAGDPTATVLIAPTSYTQVAGNANQSNVAYALNSFIPATGGDKLVVSTALDSLSASQYNQAFNAIMPTLYQSLATIAFNSANAQNSELVQRLWGLRVAGTGFSMSGFADNTFVMEGQGDGDKGVMDAKKDILRPGSDSHWGMFVDGNGIFAQSSSANMLPTYNFESGGITTGFTYKWNENFGTGIYAGYEGTYAKFNNGGGVGGGSSLINNSARFGIFGTYGQKNEKNEAVGFYADAMAGGGYNNYAMTRNIAFGSVTNASAFNRTATSSPGAGELDTMLAGGYDVKRGNWTFGPTTSLQYTYLGVNSVNETGAQSLDFNSGGWNTSSLIYSLGAHAAYSWQVNKNVLVVPQLSLSWQHEFMQNPYAISGSLGGSPNFSNWSAAPIRDTLYTGVGFTVEFAKRWNTSLFYNAAAGNADTRSENIFWSAGVRF